MQHVQKGHVGAKMLGQNLYYMLMRSSRSKNLYNLMSENVLLKSYKHQKIVINCFDNCNTCLKLLL